MKKIIFLVCIALLAACHKDDDNDKQEDLPGRTVLVYMSGENSLSYTAPVDLQEMKEGSKKIGKNDNLLVYYDRRQTGELPWLGRIKDGIIVDSVSVADMNISNVDPPASDPHVMEDVLKYAYSHYPALDGYGLVLWGHCNGWVLEDSIAYTRAWGIDDGRDQPGGPGRVLINIPTIRRVLEKQPHLDFIFADCCLFMCMESVYELREVADYIIGPPAEIPTDGAPYATMVPAMFDRDDFATKMVENYYEDYEHNLLLTAVETKGMDELAEATRNVLEAIYDRLDTEYPDVSGLIHYYYDSTNDGTFKSWAATYHDAGDFIMRYATDEEYQTWKEALDNVIVAKTYAEWWTTDKNWNPYYTDFTMSPERAHGLSMFIRQDPISYYYQRRNPELERFLWYYAVWERPTTE